MSTKGMPQADHEFHPAPTFDDVRNFTVGAVRIIWAHKTSTQDAGWVLHGGQRTVDRMRAHAYAVEMDALCKKAGA